MKFVGWVYSPTIFNVDEDLRRISNIRQSQTVGGYTHPTNCNSRVDVDSGTVEKEQDGLHLKVKCPKCGKWFLVQQVANVRTQLEKARFGYISHIDAQDERIELK